MNTPSRSPKRTLFLNTNGSIKNTYCYWLPSIMTQSIVRIESLKAWHDVIKMEFIIYLMMSSFTFIYPHFMLYTLWALLSVSFALCIRSCTEYLSYGFLTNRWLVHNRFIDLSNPLEVIVHHLLIGGMTGLGYRDKFLMVSALVCMVTHWTRPIVSYDLRLSNSHDITKLFIMLSLNLERILSLC